MWISGTSARALAAALLLLVAVGGCGGKGRGTPSPVTDVTGPSGPAKARGEENGHREEQAPKVQGEGVRLPGQDRFYPSEDPRNRPRPDASGASPLAPVTPTL